MKSRRNSKHPRFRQHFNKTSSIQLEIVPTVCCFSYDSFFLLGILALLTISIKYRFGMVNLEMMVGCNVCLHLIQKCTLYMEQRSAGKTLQVKMLLTRRMFPQILITRTGFSIQNIFPENALFCQLFQIAVNRRCSNRCTVFFQLLSQVGNGEVFACTGFQQSRMRSFCFV